MKQKKLMLGNNIELLKKIPDNSIDSVVSDPPYGLSFMGKKWDYDVPSVEFWQEVLRVLKPGGHVLSFGGTRTYHRMVVNLEDAGFEIRDQIMWLYGSGFPKSLNVGKAVDKLNGLEIPKNKMRVVNSVGIDNYDGSGSGRRYDMVEYDVQNEYEGWGTALKPANEPICVARKPLSEKSVAENVLKWGTGGINIDGCRVGNDIIKSMGTEGKQKFKVGENNKVVELGEHEGRFPANLILECCCNEVIKGEKGEVKTTNRIRKMEAGGGLEINKDKSVEGIDNYNDKGDIHTNPECPCYQLDSQSGVSESKKGKPRTTKNFNQNAKIGGGECNVEYNDKGGASRFFYQAKVSKKERNMGLDGFEEKKKEFETTTRTNKETADKFGCERKGTAKNTHPTVKPVQLMAYLCRLITPEGGIILDPYMGSGSTGIAALLEGFRFCGMEMDKSYFEIAQSRIENYEKYREFLK